MLRLLADEHISWPSSKGCCHDFLNWTSSGVRDANLQETDDRLILAWAAENDRVIVTHDHDTMIGFAYERIERGESMAGALLLDDRAPLARLIEDMLLAAYCYSRNDMQNWIEYIPLNASVKPPDRSQVP